MSLPFSCFYLPFRPHPQTLVLNASITRRSLSFGRSGSSLEFSFVRFGVFAAPWLMAPVSGNHRLAEFSVARPSPGRRPSPSSPGLAVSYRRSSPLLAFSQSALSSHLGSPLPLPLAARALPSGLRLQVSAPFTPTFLPLLYSRSCCHLPLLASLRQSALSRLLATHTPRNYDVFLSFRDEDTCTDFMDFLYKSLSASGLHVFRDDAAVRNQQIGPEVIQAIRTSRIVIPIITKLYAQSNWCLHELTEIMDCHRKHGKSVFPVFYKVNVADLGRQCSNLRNFEEALCEREMQCRREEVQEWVEALRSLTRIRGWMSQAIANGHEGKLVKMVVAKVWSELEISWIERSSMFIKSGKKRRESELQVFLSFRGADTRYNLAAFLYTSLDAEGIQVFNDDDPALIGKDCVHEIRNAIDHCKISIPILSSNYASSQWCLDDLAQMVECKRTKGQIILPIFYKVNMSHVRDVSHLFGKYMLRHKELVDEITYERWERALKEVGCTRGWVSDDIANGHEAVLVKEVVKEVSRLLNDP